MSSPNAFKLWRENSIKDRIGTDVAVSKFLALQYPHHHITRTNSERCDLVGFADAGYAIKKPERAMGYDATRFYKAPKLRQEKGEGKVVEDVKFAQWRYVWEGTEFLVYELAIQDYFVRTTKVSYVLAPLDTAQADAMGHHPATDRLLGACGIWTKALHDEIYVYDDQQWKKDKELYTSVQGASWDDVVLDAPVKAKLVHDVEGFFDNQALYHAMKVPWKRGVIFHGVPGNGKTISIKALVNALSTRDPPVPSLYVKSLDGCASPKHALGQIFAKARVVAPCLLIFEDLDSLVDDKNRSYFLNEVDGLDSNEGILMIGSTNHLAELDPAITKRPSRFDRKYHFKVPNEEGRATYCRYWKQKFDASSSSSVDFSDDICPVVAKITEGFSYAYIKELFITSLLSLARATQELHGEDDDVAQDGSDSHSNPDGVVVETPTISSEGTERPKRVMPEVEVPESLQDNALMKTILREAKTLWEQMENSEQEAKRKKAAPSCMPSQFPFRPSNGEEDD
jgi:transitional endoplasmic reticulum ATPase